ncbi:MAG: large-conductance mechanosensitive channel, MscL family [Glaciihabitans sp.]|nr:large-conductance mechanosensitive channel, MscL family [Glaciihabitans sp.]
MLKGFKEFILRGNVIDLAVAVVIGAAFSAIVTSIVGGVLNPAIGALFNAESLSEALVVKIPTMVDGAEGEPARLLFGSVIAAVIQFLIVAVVVYFALIVPINYLKKRAFQKKESGVPAVHVDTPPTDLELLTEIRDLLAKANTGTSPAFNSGDPQSGGTRP